MANKYPKINNRSHKINNKNMKRSDKIKAYIYVIIAMIIVVISIITIMFISTEMLKFICYLRAKLNGAADIIFVTPGELTTVISPLVSLLVPPILIIILIACIRICLGKDKLSLIVMRIKNQCSPIMDKKVAIFFLIIILGIFDMSVDYSVIYKDKIFHRSPIDILGKYYEYSDIKEVKVSEVKTILYYDLVMQDGTEIDLTSIKSNYEFIPYVEDNIDNKVPHVVHKNYSSVLSEKYLPHYISKKFQIID